MPKIKLPKALLANEHLLIRKRAKRSMFAIAKLKNISIADLQEEMINTYLDGQYLRAENREFYESYYISQSNQ